MAGLNESTQERGYAVHREPAERKTTYKTITAGSVLEAMLESIKGVIAKLFSGTVDGTTPPASYASTPQEQNIRRG